MRKDADEDERYPLRKGEQEERTQQSQELEKGRKREDDLTNRIVSRRDSVEWAILARLVLLSPEASAEEGLSSWLRCPTPDFRTDS